MLFHIICVYVCQKNKHTQGFYLCHLTGRATDQLAWNSKLLPSGSHELRSRLGESNESESNALANSKGVGTNSSPWHGSTFRIILLISGLAYFILHHTLKTGSQDHSKALTWDNFTDCFFPRSVALCCFGLTKLH